MLAAHVAQAERAVVIMCQRRDHFVILLPQLLWGWVSGQVQTHGNAEPLDAQTGGVVEKYRDPLFGGPAGIPREVAVQVPDP